MGKLGSVRGCGNTYSHIQHNYPQVEEGRREREEKGMVET